MDQRDERRRSAGKNAAASTRQRAAGKSAGQGKLRHKSETVQETANRRRSHSARATLVQQNAQGVRVRQTARPQGNIRTVQGKRSNAQNTAAGSAGGTKNAGSISRRTDLQTTKRVGTKQKPQFKASAARRTKNTPLTSTNAARREKLTAQPQKTGARSAGRSAHTAQMRHNSDYSSAVPIDNLGARRRQTTVKSARQNRRQTSLSQNGANALYFGVRQKKLLLIVASLIALAALIVFAYVYVKGQVTEYHQAKTEPSQVEKFAPVACTAKNLDVQLEVTGRDDGAGAVFNVVFANQQSTAPCYLDVGNSHLQVQVTSGSQNVWNSQVCKAGEQSKQLLLSKGVSSRQYYLWNGIHAGPACDGTSLAQAGTYRVSLILDDEVLIENAPFMINSNGTISALSEAEISQTQEADQEAGQETSQNTERDSNQEVEQNTERDSNQETEQNTERDPNQETAQKAE